MSGGFMSGGLQHLQGSVRLVCEFQFSLLAHDWLMGEGVVVGENMRTSTLLIATLLGLLLFGSSCARAEEEAKEASEETSEESSEELVEEEEVVEEEKPKRNKTTEIEEEGMSWCCIF
ncbi:hypothetical protein WMY93_005968 [Mugilogobius chulae]|uniref:Uncharacterized protein n=1 Tax=Mugilogobius chulae TaxID=88201 RepID=A0AAW0PIC1_9GOBI